jgi:hypothetical protein
MPKGGAEKYEKRIGEETRLGRARGEQLQGTLQPQYNQFWQNYNQAVNRQTRDYGNVMGRYQEFADTGGFSPQDISNMRARAMSPLRATYATAQRNLGRSLGAGGPAGSSGVLQARMAREQGQGMSDVARATEGDIAEQKQRGRLSGIGGMLGAYGATPGQAALYGNQALGGAGQLLDLNQAQNQFANAMTGQMGQYATMPGKWQTGFNNLLAGAQVAGQIAYPWMNALPRAGGGGIPTTGGGVGGTPWTGYPGFAGSVPSYGPGFLGGGSVPPYGGGMYSGSRGPYQ